MTSVLPFVVAGTVVGSLYGLAAVGLVLTYKTSGIFNFAHGAVGAATAFLFYELRDVRGVPWPLALVLAVAAFAPLLGLLLSRLAAALDGAPTVRRVVATIGVLLVLQGTIQARYGIVPITFDTPLPDNGLDVLGAIVGVDQIITTTLAGAALIGLTVLFTRTRIGLQMRAVVDNAELLDLSGDAPARIRALSWMLGATFAGLSGVLLAPTIQLDALLLTLLVVQAFGAAAIGRFGSLNLTFVGGLAIGVVQFLLRAPAVKEVLPVIDSLPGLDQSVSFIALFVVLLVAGTSIAAPSSVPKPLHVRTLAPRARLVGVLLGATVVIALPLLLPARSPVLIQAAVFVTIFASLYLLVEISGQVSLAQTAIVAIGATTFSHLTSGAGLPWLVGVVAAGAIAIPLGAVVAIPAIRVSGLFLALASLGFGILVEQMVYTRPIMFGSLGQRFGERPAVFGLDTDAGYFYLCALIAVGAIALVLTIRRSRLGRLLGALADSPVALSTNGASPNVTRVIVFCIASCMAGVSGALLVGVVGSVSSTGVSPTALVSFNSLLWLAVLAFVARSPVISPVLAATFLVVVPSLSSNPAVAQYLAILFGIAAMFAATHGQRLTDYLRGRAAVDPKRRRRTPAVARLRTRGV